MNKYNYPAIFTEEDDGSISVTFPDFSDVKVKASNMLEALNKSQDALCFSLVQMENENTAPPKATNVDKIDLENGQSVLQIDCDTLQYRREKNSEPYKKTISIPRWMHEEAVRRDIPCSQVFRKALLREMGIN